MPRISRIYTKEGIFHILTRGNNRQAVFHDNKDYQAYLNLLRRYKQEHSFVKRGRFYFIDKSIGHSPW